MVRKSVASQQPIKMSIEPSSAERFINRELSWLAFNFRVLEEASNGSYPLLERLRFVSISSANLDEFYMVRVAGLKGQTHAGVVDASADGRTPVQQLSAISVDVVELLQEQQASFRELRKELTKADFHLVDERGLGDDEKAWLEAYFLAQIFPALTPLAIDPAHPFPFIPNRGACLALQLARPDHDEKLMALVPLPAKIPRFIRLSGQVSRFVAVEHAILMSLEHIFPGFKLEGQGVFRILRDSEMEVDEEAEDLVRSFESALRARRRGHVIRLDLDSHMPASLKQFVADQLQVSAEDIFELAEMVGQADLEQLIVGERSDLLWHPFSARFPERIRDFQGDCLAAIRAKDIVVHHPYESFDVVLQFLRQAASDPDVIAIKQTLYRTTQDSQIVRALIEAAESGKSVTAMIELKARFDEEANIQLARDLERAGVQVVFGLVGLKTHAKISLVVRREGQNLRSYAHFGTGNYHPVTAKIYTDISFFTCEPAFCRDAVRLFNFMTGYAKPDIMEKLSASPISLKETVDALIDAEIAHAEAGRPASIWMKLNSLVDPSIIDHLYQASNAGVSIDLVVRGICCLRPGVAGLSENIRVRSIIGRFLEHARIICVGNGYEMPADKAKVFISSADLMPRNLYRRVEHLVPIENLTVHRQILNQIMVANLRDETNSWVLDADGRYHRLTFNETGFSAHRYFMTNPSLSGRGSALESGAQAKTDLQAPLK